MHRIRLVVAALACAALALPAAAAAGTPGAAAGNGLRSTGGDYNAGKPKPLPSGAASQMTQRRPGAARARTATAAEATPPVGTTRTWFANDDTDFVYLKPYTLKAVSAHMEVWVANDLNFPAGDCRNGVRTTVTQADVDYFVNQFETVMYPLESATFSVPPARDGTQINETLLPLVGGDRDALESFLFPGDGEKIVTFIDNVRDANYYDTNNAHGFTYIAGFFWSFFNELGDRNMMTVDAFDWLHRTRPNPPHEPSSDLCTSAPAKPNQYEGTFAHEYQHLLEYYADPGEVNWINEGLSDWAQTLTGYVDPSTPIDTIGFDSHIQCFLGWNETVTDANPIGRAGGPENSLTLWGDQVADNEAEILCDYGAAYSFMEFLDGRYGDGFMTFLHRGQENGLAGLDEALRAFHIRTTARALLHEWAAAMALDGVVDDGARVNGDSRDRGRHHGWNRRARHGHGHGHGSKGRTSDTKRYEIPTLNAFVNWANDDAYDTPGAPPNGSDYVRVRDAGGRYLSAKQIRSISFDGEAAHEPKPVEWTVDPSPAGHAGNPSLYSGAGDNLDRAIIRQVTIPAAPATLTADMQWDTEIGFDSGYVQISTDDGQTWTSLGNADTVDELDAGADQVLVDNLPGLNGDSGGWRSESFDVSAYAGQTVLLAFRYITDVNTGGDGWWVDDVRLNGTLVSDGASLDGWQSATQLHPVPIAGYTVQLVGYTKDHKKASVATLRLNRRSDGFWSSKAISKLLEKKADTVAVLVMYDEPTETIFDYAPYALRVNGVLQPGGS
jgi:hypothetical protein